MHKEFSKILLQWFDQYGRKNLPWQQDINPYRVWVSEIMLQQTQVATVIPYFERFMQSFPNVKALASASVDDVLAHWAGLGYYSRGRNLHRAAQMIESEFKGQFPETLESIQTLPGIGPSTAGAILSIAMQQSAPILDGNVKRVLTRLFGIEGWPGTSNINKQLWELADKLTPSQRNPDYTQAIMDLGATLCVRSKPKCNLCPFQQVCVANKENKQHLLPTRKPKKSIPTRTTCMLLITNQAKELLLVKRPPTGIWGGLWSFPEVTLDTDLSSWCKENYACEVETIKTLSSFKHTFSHFHLEITPSIITVKSKHSLVMASDKQVWYNVEDAKTLGIAAPVKKLLGTLS